MKRQWNNYRWMLSWLSQRRRRLLYRTLKHELTCRFQKNEIRGGMRCSWGYIINFFWIWLMGWWIWLRFMEYWDLIRTVYFQMDFWRKQGCRMLMLECWHSTYFWNIKLFLYPPFLILLTTETVATRHDRVVYPARLLEYRARDCITTYIQG